MGLNEDQLTRKLDELTGEVSEIKTNIASISGSLTNLDKWQEKMDSRLNIWQDKMDERVRAVEVSSTEIKHVKELHEVVIATLSKVNDKWHDSVTHIGISVAMIVIAIIVTKVLGG